MDGKFHFDNNKKRETRLYFILRQLFALFIILYFVQIGIWCSNKCIYSFFIAKHIDIFRFFPFFRSLHDTNCYFSIFTHNSMKLIDNRSEKWKQNQTIEFGWMETMNDDRNRSVFPGFVSCFASKHILTLAYRDSTCLIFVFILSFESLIRCVEKGMTWNVNISVCFYSIETKKNDSDRNRMISVNMNNEHKSNRWFLRLNIA